MRQLRIFTLITLLVFAVLLPGAAWAANALIVTEASSVVDTDNTNLNNKLVTAGYTVTVNAGVPGGSLSGYAQIWDTRFNNIVLSASDITAYLTYLQGGGSLFLMGENTGFNTRNNSIVSFVATAGGGTVSILTPANAQTVVYPLTGPNPLSAITFQAAAGSPLGGTGNGTLVTYDASTTKGSTILWPRGTLTNAPTGTLMVVFDVNFLGSSADANSQTFTQNMIAYLAAPGPISGIPAPPSLILVLLGGGGVAFYQIRRRMRKANA